MTAEAQDGWIEWNGRDRPVSPSTIVAYQYTRETRQQAESGDVVRADEPNLVWSKVIAYRVVCP